MLSGAPERASVLHARVAVETCGIENRTFFDRGMHPIRGSRLNRKPQNCHAAIACAITACRIAFLMVYHGDDLGKTQPLLADRIFGEVKYFGIPARSVPDAAWVQGRQ